MEFKTRGAQNSARNQAMRDTFNASYYQLQICQGELNDTKNQLNCLIHFVKRAWSGDIDAAFHVANIIGIAPPDLHLQGDTKKLVAVPKPAAVNNWAYLTNGLLKRENAEKEQERKRRQVTYLQGRERFLDNQLNGFVQQPEMRVTKDVLSIIEKEMLRGLEKGQEQREKSIIELQSQLREQRSALVCKKRLSKGQLSSDHWQAEAQRRRSEDSSQYFDLYMDATQPQFFQKEHSAKKTKAEKTASATQKRLTCSTAETLQSQKTPNAIKIGHPQAFSKKNAPQPFLAKDPESMTKSGSVKSEDSKRRQSLDASGGECKLDDDENELKRLVPELQKKLSINPDGYLKL